MSEEAENAAKTEAFAEGAPAAPEDIKGATEPPADNTVKPLWDGWSAPATPADALKLGEDYARMEGLWCSESLFELREQIEFGEHESDEPEYVRPEGIDADDDDADDMPCACEDCSRLRRVEKKISQEGLACTDIQACSVGILIMSVLDGPAVSAFFQYEHGAYDQKPKYTNVEDMLTDHPVGGPATIFLAAGMKRVVQENLYGAEDESKWESHPEEKVESFIAGPKDRRRSKDKFKKQQLCAAKNEVISVNDSQPRELGLTTGEQVHATIVQGFMYAREYALRYQHLLGFGQNVEPTDPPALES